MTDIYAAIEAEIPHLLRTARRLVYKHNNPIEADDLVQDCMVKILDNVHQWREGGNVRGWLGTTLRRTNADSKRDASRQKREGVVVELNECVDLPELSRAADQEKYLELCDLARAIGDLPKHQRIAVTLVDAEGLVCTEAAASLGVPLRTLKSRLDRGRKKVRKKLTAGLD